VNFQNAQKNVCQTTASRHGYGAGIGGVKISNLDY
jgi:hypothetical protein